MRGVVDLSKLRHLGRDGVATWASALLLGGAMLAWRDLFFFAKAVYIPAWAEGLPGQLHLPAYMAFLCLLPASFATLTLPAAIRATVSAVCVARLRRVDALSLIGVLLVFGGAMAAVGSSR